MNDLTTMILLVALPPAAIVFLAMVWAKGWPRIVVTTAVFLVPVAIFAYLVATAGRSGDNLAALGIVILAVILLGGAMTGAVLGGIVVLVRTLRRRRTELQG